MTWHPTRLPFAGTAPAPPAPTVAAAPWKDTPPGAVRRRRHASNARQDLVEQLLDGRLTFEGYARLLGRVDEQWRRDDQAQGATRVD